MKKLAIFSWFGYYLGQMDTTTDRPIRVFVTAVEASGDMHCAGIMNAMKQGGANVEFVGIGGRKMASAGSEIIEDTVDQAVMLYQALGRLVYYYKLIKRISRYFAENQIDLVLVCDSPSFNYHVACAAKKHGIRTIFYVAPQLWAWGGWRIRKYRKLFDGQLCRMACILPFEQDWFADRGVECRFVGNPLLEDIDPENVTAKTFADYSIAGANIALMPGSRNAEIKSLWRPMQEIAMRLKARHLEISFTTVAADERILGLLKSSEINGFRCDYSIDSVIESARRADFSIVASGSATVQVAAAACPMVIMYQSNKYLWHLVGRWIVTAKRLALVNILADADLVPEFMPYFESVAPIVKICDDMLSDEAKLKKMSADLAEMIQPLAQQKSSQTVAKMALDTISASDLSSP